MRIEQVQLPIESGTLLRIEPARRDSSVLTEHTNSRDIVFVVQCHSLDDQDDYYQLKALKEDTEIVWVNTRNWFEKNFIKVSK